MDIRKSTCLIIRSGKMYLVGRIVYSTDLRWSVYAWDAWRTRDMEAARMVAGRIGGTVMLFNPISGQLREMDDMRGPAGLLPEAG